MDAASDVEVLVAAKMLAPDRVVDAEPRPGLFERGARGQDVYVTVA